MHLFIATWQEQLFVAYIVIQDINLVLREKKNVQRTRLTDIGKTQKYLVQWNVQKVVQQGHFK